MEAGDLEFRGAMPRIRHQNVEMKVVLGEALASIQVEVRAKLEELRDTFLPELGAVRLGHRQLNIINIENLARSVWQV